MFRGQEMIMSCRVDNQDQRDPFGASGIDKERLSLAVVAIGTYRPRMRSLCTNPYKPATMIRFAPSEVPMSRSAALVVIADYEGD
jgi:hypothetical protein